MRTSGFLFIIGAILVFIPYTILTISFDYPDVLRSPAGVILEAFHRGGTSLVLVWLAFALSGIPLVIAFSRIGEFASGKQAGIKWITTLGIAGGVAQIIGLMRWVFVVPVLARNFANSQSVAERSSIEISFITIHQFGGVLLGEYLGQLLTVIWTAAMSIVLFRLAIIDKAMAVGGVIISGVYFLAQAELLATVIPSFPIVPWAGFVGSTAWLIWLIPLGRSFIRKKKM